MRTATMLPFGDREAEKEIGDDVGDDGLEDMIEEEGTTKTKQENKTGSPKI